MAEAALIQPVQQGERAVYMSYLTTNLPLAAGAALVIYLVLYGCFRRSIVSITDPLNYGSLLIACYLAGAIVFAFSYSVNPSYIYVLLQIAVFVIAGALASRSRRPIAAPRLTTPSIPQLLFTSILTFLAAVNIVVNQLFGVMPLLSGTEARSAYGSVVSPLLYALSPFLSTLVLLIFLLTELPRVRIIAAIGVGLFIVSALLGGSKSAPFSALFALSAADYVLHLRRKAVSWLGQRKNDPRVTKFLLDLLSQ